MIFFKNSFSLRYFAIIFLSLSQSIVAYEKLTLLTAPIGHHGSQYGGPLSVTTSLISGLTHLGVIFNHNPLRFEDVGDVVMVLSDVRALGQAIQLKRQGKIKKLLAGPNLVVRANQDGGILASPEIDVCIVPSYWVKPSYEDDEPTLKGRIQIWYAGVDTHYWSPSISFQEKMSQGSKEVLVYWKTEGEAFCRHVERVLREKGFHPIRVRYGSYSKDQFKHYLQRSLFAVFITRSESQGIAFAESWAMDVPTLVWDPQEPLTIMGKVHWPVAACPYINPANGAIWKNAEHLAHILDNINDFSSRFGARASVIESMSDEVSARMLMNIVNNG
jgi:hypothetical protein